MCKINIFTTILIIFECIYLFYELNKIFHTLKKKKKKKTILK